MYTCRSSKEQGKHAIRSVEQFANIDDTDVNVQKAERRLQLSSVTQEVSGRGKIRPCCRRKHAPAAKQQPIADLKRFAPLPPCARRQAGVEMHCSSAAADGPCRLRWGNQRALVDPEHERHKSEDAHHLFEAFMSTGSFLRGQGAI